MDKTVKRKVLAGRQIRKLRSELGLSQSSMAGELGISVSYLNLIERNERPVTAQLLIRLSETYSVDPRSFAQDDEFRAIVELEEIFLDPTFQHAMVPRNEIRLLAEGAPTAAHAIKRLYRAYIDSCEIRASSQPHTTEDRRDEPALISAIEDPVEKIRSFLEQASNHFPQLESKAAELLIELAVEDVVTLEAITTRLWAKHGIRVQTTTTDEMRWILRYYDRHRRKLLISERLDISGRSFQAAFHLGLLEARDQLDEISAKVATPESESWKLARITLCNYFAAALMMPYDRFADAAESLSYDLDMLCARFSTSLEQVAHRLTTLAGPTQHRVPFFMIRVDPAGNISKRFSAGSFPFARFGGTCARWNIYSAFANPGRIERQLVEMPDGTKWFSISRALQPQAVPWGEPDAKFAIVLGCELKHAHRLIYAKGLDLKAHEATPIGINCRLCERSNCAQRAAPALMHRIHTVENTRGVSPFELGFVGKLS